MASNQFGWNQVQLKDTGRSSQEAIRNAQQATQNVVKSVQDYQADRGAIDKANYKQQGVLNNKEASLGVQDYNSLEDMAAAQESEGALSEQAAMEKYGTNFDYTAFKDKVNTQYADLANKRLQNLGTLDKDIEDRAQQGIGVVNQQETQLLTMTKDSTQYNALKTQINARKEVVLGKQNASIVADTIKEFGGYATAGENKHGKAIERLTNRAARAEYTESQLDTLKAAYKLAEQASLDLSPQELELYTRTLKSGQDESAQAITANENGLVTANAALKQSEQRLASVDLPDMEPVNAAITDILAKHDDADIDSMYAGINGSALKLKDKDGNDIQATGGRLNAIFMELARAGIKSSADDQFEQVLQGAINNNNSTFRSATANFAKATLKFNDHNTNISKISAEKIKYASNLKGAIKSGKGMPPLTYTRASITAMEEQAAKDTEYLKDAMNPDTENSVLDPENKGKETVPKEPVSKAEKEPFYDRERSKTYAKLKIQDRGKTNSIIPRNSKQKTEKQLNAETDAIMENYVYKGKEKTEAIGSLPSSWGDAVDRLTDPDYAESKKAEELALKNEAAKQKVTSKKREALDSMMQDDFSASVSKAANNSTQAQDEADIWVTDYNTEAGDDPAKITQYTKKYTDAKKHKLLPEVSRGIKTTVSTGMFDAKLKELGWGNARLERALGDVVKVETRGGSNNVVSPTGAAGLFQIVQGTFKDALNPERGMITDNMLSTLGKSRPQLMAMSNKERRDYLRNNNKASIIFGTAIYLDKVARSQRRKGKS